MTTTVTPPELVRTGRPVPASAVELAEIGEILTAAGETAYIWQLQSDQIIWHANAAAVLGLATVAGIAKGAAFHLHIAAEHAGNRFEAISRTKRLDRGEGVAYRLAYRFLPEGRRSTRSIWLEDQGRWFAGSDGRPAIARGVLRVIDERRSEEERLRFLSEHDPLTGLMNPTRLAEATRAALSESAATGRPFALMLVAINNLAIINETFGFTVGDEVIAAIGRKLASRLRAGDCIGRFSANKFGILVHDCEADGLQAAAKRLIRTIREEPIETSVTRLSATVSIGVVQLPRHAQSVPEAFSAALDALDDAKTARQDRFVTYLPNERKQSRRRQNVEMADAIIAALQEKRMMMALQPIVRTDTMRPAFYECLLRMRTRDDQIISAGEFIPVAEQIGLSRLIDQRVLELAVDLVKADPRLHLSFNVSGLTSPDHDWLVHLHRQTGGDRRLTQRLTVEITETAAIQDLNETVTFVDTLKELGCRVAIDDFGAGYTSFRGLRHLGVDMVKIDGSFVRNIAADRGDRFFVETLIQLAKSLGMQTVAEWVGNQETAEIMKQTGIDYMQGFLFGLPQIVILPSKEQKA
jgi:diguanylate cyclase (GGDEF)-like protein